MTLLFDLTRPPPDFTDNPYPGYQKLLRTAPVLAQPDDSYLISSHQALDRIYRDTKNYSSDKTQVFKPKFGDSPLYEHHTTSLVFNDPPLHTRVRKIMVGAMTPRAIAGMEAGLIALIDKLLTELPDHVDQGEVDLIANFAASIPLNVIGNLFNMPEADRAPLRDWSLAILGALEPTVSSELQHRGDAAVVEFKQYLADLTAERRKRPGDPDTDVLTRLIQSEHGPLSETELLQNCIFTLNAGHETTTNLIGNAIGSLQDFVDQRQRLIDDPELINTAVDEFLRFESPNQLGNRLTTAAVEIEGYSIPSGTNLHLMIGAANRDEKVFAHPDKLDLARKPNRHLAFAGGPHACLGLNLAKMEGRIAIGQFVQRYPNYQIVSKERSTRLRFRGFNQLRVQL